MKAKNSVWLEKGGKRVFVDVGTPSYRHWSELGYAQPGTAEVQAVKAEIAPNIPNTSVPDQPQALDTPEVKVRKTKAKKVVADAE